MKQILGKLAMAAMAMLAIGGMASCDDDDDWYYYDYPYRDQAGDGRDNGSWWNESYTDPSEDYVEMANALRGHWSGSLDATGQVDSQTVTYHYTTDVEFDQYQTGTVYGRGRQLDYLTDENDSLVLDMDRNFTWHIDTSNGNIVIVYDASGGNAAFTMTIPYESEDSKYGGFHLDATEFFGTMFADDDSEFDDFDFQRYTFAKKGPSPEL